MSSDHDDGRCVWCDVLIAMIPVATMFGVMALALWISGGWV